MYGWGLITPKVATEQSAHREFGFERQVQVGMVIWRKLLTQYGELGRLAFEVVAQARGERWAPPPEPRPTSGRENP